VNDPEDTTSRLARRLATPDAVVIGLGSMIGAGVFAAVGPAAAAAGSGLLAGLAIAAVVAYCNATSSARLAAVYPSSGGTYVYGRERLGHFWGYLAGWGFVVGKTASCAAMALTFGAYAAPAWRRPLAVGAVAALTAVNYRGIRRTALLTRAIVAVVLASLAAVVVAALFGGQASPDNLGSVDARGWNGILESAGLLFFAVAGYARIATLGEEVIDPARTIPRAIPLALGITLVVYASVATAALLAVGPEPLADSTAPLATAVGAGSLEWLAPAVRVGGTVAALGVLLSLLAGVGRTTFAMAANGDLPRRLAAVHPMHRVPHRAEMAVSAIVVATVLVAGLRGAIGFSSFAVLTYYAIANAAAWTLPAEPRGRARFLAGAGMAGCVVLALTLPAPSVAAGVVVLAAGAGMWFVRARAGPGP
jgi:APA family basic amino acid/polyamine antiporter